MRQAVRFAPFFGVTLAWLMPLHLMPWVTWHSEVPVFAGVLVAATLALASAHRSGWSSRVPVPTMPIALLSVGVLSFAQASLGVIRYFGDAWVVVLYLLLCLCAFAIGFAAQRTEGSDNWQTLDALAWTLLAAGVGCTVIALVQAFDVWTTSEWIARTPTLRRSGSNLGQPNQMSTLVLMAAMSLLYLADRGRLARATAIILGLLLAIGEATTESRTGLVAIGALTAWWFLRRFQSRLGTREFLLGVAVVLSCYVAWPPLVEWFHGEGGPEVARVNTQLGLRTIVWPQLLDAAAQKPWFGWGARQTSVALTSVVHAHEVSEPYTYAHNIVLELVLAFGVPATMVVLGGLTIWVWRRWRLRAELGGWYCLALCAPLAVHMLLEFPYAYAYLLAPVMFALGALDARSAIRPPRSIRALPLGAALACTWVLAGWSALEYVQVEEDFRVARFEAGRIGVTPDEYERPAVRVLTQLGAMLEAARIVPRPGMPPEMVELAGDTAARFPWPALQNRYALSLALNGQPAAAEQELRVIRAMHGEGTMRDIRLNWETLREERFPQLGSVRMPQQPVPISSSK